ncbi:MAG TPA: hypothetical protein VFI54_03655 [Solirubrobacteraceae bacterium]|nr:hypothetical protein [Solirubrobacteraceae bacterium]
MREPREAANLAELYDEDPMPWSRVNDAIGAGSIPPEVRAFWAPSVRTGDHTPLA